jgi:hypothetical protein
MEFVSEYSLLKYYFANGEILPQRKSLLLSIILHSAGSLWLAGALAKFMWELHQITDRMDLFSHVKENQEMLNLTWSTIVDTLNIKPMTLI